ncbi:MAG TPA: hypothetical protein VGZ02_02395 [Candidatus Baltobacteraceae bacterium]|jgi:hypothetical protein|nr:hypothetical protein [Candidatus Baltobacteraceae bacterium]
MSQQQQIPPQHQERQPGIENRMQPKPRYVHPDHRPSGMLDGRTVLIAGRQSGSAAAPGEARRRNREQRVHQCVQRKSAAHRLFGDQRRYNRFYQVAGLGYGGERRPGKRGCTGADLDAADSG